MALVLFWGPTRLVNLMWELVEFNEKMITSSFFYQLFFFGKTSDFV